MLFLLRPCHAGMVLIGFLCGLTQCPIFWSDGSFVLDSGSGIASAGGEFTLGFWETIRTVGLWGVTWIKLGQVLMVGSIVVLSDLFLVLQTAQRAELWEVVFAIQAGSPVHAGVDHLNVVRHVGRICDEVDPVKPFLLMDDGDLLALIFEMVLKRGGDTTRVTEVRGHATEDMAVRSFQG